jgi:hypothetical protein
MERKTNATTTDRFVARAGDDPLRLRGHAQTIEWHLGSIELRDRQLELKGQKS